MPEPNDLNTAAETTEVTAPVRAFRATDRGYRWEGVDVLEYKPTGTHFRDITRQVLFGEGSGLPAELRYFEVAAGGHSTFEKHLHVHAVLILRGKGQVLVGNEVTALSAFDLVYVPPLTWHQFHAAPDEALGFLCLVDCDRDRPIRPTADDVDALRADPVIRDFIRV